jgi:RsiW-degrading membrane proteinase PrsW (M82 family)
MRRPLASGSVLALTALVFALACALLSLLSPRGFGVGSLRETELVLAEDGLQPELPLEELVRERLRAAGIRADVRRTTPQRLMSVVVASPWALAARDLLRWRAGAYVYYADMSARGDQAEGSFGSPGYLAESAQSGRWVEPAPCGIVTLARYDLTPRGLELGRLPETCDPDRQLLVGRGATLVGLGTIDVRNGVMFLTVTGPAQRLALHKVVLETRALPPLRVVTMRDGPIRVPLAVLALGLPWLISLVWVFFLRRFDRAHPEPLSLIVAAFLIGATSVVPAVLLEPVCLQYLTWLRGAPWVYAGIVEELCKFLGVYLVVTRFRHFDEPVDGIVYSGAASLGFAALENVRVFSMLEATPATIVARGLLTVPAHMFFGVLWGSGLGRRLVAQRAHVGPLLLASMLAHMAFDALVMRDEHPAWLLLLMLALTTAFIFLVRQALRRGRVAGRVEVTHGGTTFTVGDRRAFILVVACLYGFGALTLLFAREFLGGASISWPALLCALALALAVGSCAFAIPATLPLDLVLDERGFTFAGRTIAWPDVRDIRLEADDIIVRTLDDENTVGPASERRRRDIARAMQANLDRARRG